MPDRDLLQDYRLRVIRMGQAVSWLALGSFAVVGIRDLGFGDNAVAYPVIGFSAALLMLSLLPWSRIFEGRLGDGLIAMWCGLAVGGMLVADAFRAGEALIAAFLAPVVFAGATLAAPSVVALVGATGLAGYAAALTRGAVGFGVTDYAVRLVGFGAAALIVVTATRAVRNQMRTAARRLEELMRREEELSRREQELQRLYEISRTVGHGSNLGEVLPELVGRVMAALGASTGVVLLYRPSRETLEVISPIWVSGRAVPVQGYELALSAGGVPQRVFTTGQSAVVNEVAQESADEFLDELQASRIAAVPLQVEAKAIGVLVAADKEDGEPFNDEDMALLESLAGPSALVLNRMARYEEAREAGEKMAEVARLKTDFVSVVSHELRTPLTSIIGSLRTLQRPELAPENPNAVELLMTAERQGQRLRALIEDLLVVSRLDNQALPIRPEVVDLFELLEEVIRDVPGARPVVRLDVADEVDKMWVDPDHLSRVLRNLVENALKYAPGSSIDVWAHRRGKDVWIGVADHGPGIPYELHDAIFDRFTQLDRHETRHTGGTGLGLSIVRGLIEAMAGRVWFEPTEEGGATFTLALPVRAGTRGTRSDTIDRVDFGQP